MPWKPVMDRCDRQLPAWLWLEGYTLPIANITPMKHD